MTDDELDAIEARHATLLSLAGGQNSWTDAEWYRLAHARRVLSEEDAPALVAEVRRLRCEADRKQPPVSYLVPTTKEQIDDDELRHRALRLALGVEDWWDCADCRENFRRARGKYPPGLPKHLSPDDIVLDPPFAAPPPLDYTVVRSDPQ